MKLQTQRQCILMVSALAMALVQSVLAQPGRAQLPELPPAQGPAANPARSQPSVENNRSSSSPSLNSAEIEDETFPALALTQADVVMLLLQNNRELRNAALERIAQQQELREAERIFTPDFTPTLSVGLSDTANNPEVTREARLGSELLTPLGTTLEVTVDLIDEQDVELTVTQPLLRGAGQAVNTAFVETARLQESNNQLDLRQRLITDITGGVITYHAVIRAIRDH